MICKICDNSIRDLSTHLQNAHNTSLQNYYQKYYNIPANNNYNVDEHILIEIANELKNEHVTDCISHFKKILKEVDNNIARLQFRFNNYAYEIYKYLNIYAKNNIARRKKNEIKMLNLSIASEHKNQDTRYTKCPVCGKLNKYGYILWHVKSMHKIDKKDYFIKYFNMPQNINAELMTYSLADAMFQELKNSTFNTYEECYQNIYDSFDNNIDMVNSFDYDINKACRCLNIVKNSTTNIKQNNYNEYHNKYNNKLGYREDLNLYVRSSWEANFARILKYKGIDFQYESEKFKLKYNDNYMIYIPDFYIGNNIFIEVKGRWLNNSKLKVRLFKEQFPQYKLIIIDKHKYSKLKINFKSKIKNWE